MRDYDVVVLACDPPGWHREIDEWSDRYSKTVTVMFPTNRRTLMFEACSKFYTAVFNQTITTTATRRWRGTSRTQWPKRHPTGSTSRRSTGPRQRKIDAAVAAVVAYDRATSHVSKPKAGLVLANPW